MSVDFGASGSTSRSDQIVEHDDDLRPRWDVTLVGRAVGGTEMLPGRERRAVDRDVLDV